MTSMRRHKRNQHEMMQGLGITSILICLATAAGCAELQAVGDAIQKIPPLPPTVVVRGGPPPRGPQMTPEQLERLHAALAVKTDDRNIAVAVDEAKAIVRDLARTEACIATYERISELRRFGAP